MRYTLSELKSKLDEYLIPGHMQPGLIRWIQEGIVPGHFLQAILKNDLYEAFNRADDDNIFRIYSYIRFLYNCAPTCCWRSEKNFNAWAEHRGLTGQLDSLFKDEGDGGE